MQFPFGSAGCVFPFTSKFYLWVQASPALMMNLWVTRRWKGYFHASQPGKKKSGNVCQRNLDTSDFLKRPKRCYFLWFCMWYLKDIDLWMFPWSLSTQRHETLSMTFILDWWKEQWAKQLPRGCFLSMTLNIVWEQSGCSLWVQALETENWKSTYYKQ